MPPSRFFITMQILLVICSGSTISSSCAFSQQPPSTHASNQFEDYFNGLTIAQGSKVSRGEAAYIKLMDSIGTMTSAEIAAGIPVIDRHLDDTAEPQDPLAKPKAAGLLMYISWRPDGAELLASQMDRLTSMLNDPSHSLSGIAAFTLQHIGITRPDLVLPIFKAALKAPDVNNGEGPGSGIAIMLLRMGPHDGDVTEHVAEYMRRPDLTDKQLIDTIIGIDSSPIIPDALTAELVRCLDRPNEHIKSRALVGIARSSPSAKDAARTRVQKMANDPRETPHVRQLAAASLEREITEDPDPARPTK